MINQYIILNSAKYFSEDGWENHLLIKPLSNYFTTFTGTNRTFLWWPKGMLEESIEISFKWDNSFAPK